MTGIQIQQSGPRYHWVQILSLPLVTSVAMAIWQGPYGVYWVSSLGILLAIGSFVQAFRFPKHHPAKWITATLLASHIFMIGIGWTLQTLFLTQLPNESLTLPKISKLYQDPEGHFELKGPKQWQYDFTFSPQGSGVKLSPVNDGQYMGASEIQVWVQKLENAPKSTQVFLEKMAESMSVDKRRTAKKKMFDFKTEEANLIDGNAGLFSILDIKRFWVPLRQITLFGIKQDKYFCTVSASGLTSHSALSKILCLGIFETIKISDVPK